jgi:CTP synthase
VNTEKISPDNASDYLSDVSGILVPGGFGDRGIEGKLNTVRYARENRIPFFGICLGLQCAVIEYARNVVGLKDANSTEFNPHTPHPVIDIMENQKSVNRLGGTMRLGSYECRITSGTLAHAAYKNTLVSERHRHRFEVNNKYRDILEQHRMVICGSAPDNSLVEMIELPDHPWFVTCQFHPELKSRAMKAHPLFREFVRAAMEFKFKK